MAGPAGRSPEEEAPLQKAMRVPPEASWGATEIYFTDRPITDYRATLSADRARHAAFTHALLTRGVVKAAQKFYVSLVHTDAEVTRAIEVFDQALAAVAGTSP